MPTDPSACLNASKGEPFVSVCCTGNGARSLAYVSEGMLESRPGVLRLNLLLNRASPLAALESGIPDEAGSM